MNDKNPEHTAKEIEAKITSDYSGKKVLITGGLGFIGSNMAERLVELGADVLLVDSLIPEYGGNRANIQGFEDKVTVNISDVRDPHSMKQLVRGADYLFNLAGQTGHLDSMKDPFTDLEINCRAQLSILEACRLNNPDIRIVFAGTRQIYGKPDYLPVDEIHPLRPADVNGIHKTAGEWYHLLYSKIYGIRSTVLRLTNTIGPRMRIKDARQTFLGVWIRCLLENRPFEVWGGNQLRDFTYVDDCVRALLAAAVSPQAVGMVFNLGGERVVSLLEAAEMLVKIHGSGRFHIKEFPEERKAIDIGDYYSDDGLLRNTLGLCPTLTLEQAFEKTLNYFSSRLEHYL